MEKLTEHHCIELAEPMLEQCKNKKATYDDMRIKIKRGLKILDDKNNIEFYYSTARAFIAKQITQNEFKVFLCIVNNMKDGKSCTIEDLDKILHIGKPHIAEAIKNLKIAQCIDIVQYRSSKGNWYNLYSQKYTDKHDSITCIDDNTDLKIELPDNKIIDMDNNVECGNGCVNLDADVTEEEILIELLA